MTLASFPAPPVQTLHLGPVPIRMYALCIIAGILVAIAMSERRFVERGAPAGLAADIAVWAVGFGLVGARLYHVATDPELYFAPGRQPIRALYIWDGGLGIWGAVAGGVLGAWIAARRAGVRITPLMDAAAPGVVVAQAIGRWGNWFNQELFGRATKLPWALHVTDAEGPHPAGYYHPTFLYESLWDLGVAALVLWADARWRLGRGRAFALYVAAYTVGRGWIEALRIDHANHYGGLRLNDWVSLGVFLAASAYLLLRRGPRESALREPVEDPGGGPDGDADGVSAEGERRTLAP